MIELAAEGSPGERESFAERYLPAIRAYLRARWGASPLIQETDDAVQEVFVECFRGALRRTGRDRNSSFRGFLYGVVRNVARRFEERRKRLEERQPGFVGAEEHIPADDVALSDAFDCAWAGSVLRKARALQTTRAREKGDGALRRIELLRLRLEEDVPIREVARRWSEDPAHLHHQYATARDEFRRSLLDVVAFEHPDATPAEIRRECVRLVSFFR